MEAWGAALYGDPCHQCGFRWSITPLEAIEVVREFGERARELTCSLTGTERCGGWSVVEYVAHVGDNLRQWSESIQSARLVSRPMVGGYDPDALAAVRGYSDMTLETALWSTGRAATSWVDVLVLAVDEGVELHHAARGLQRAEDVARNNAHDAHHHLWDIRAIAAAS